MSGSATTSRARPRRKATEITPLQNNIKHKVTNTNVDISGTRHAFRIAFHRIMPESESGSVGHPPGAIGGAAGPASSVGPPAGMLGMYRASRMHLSSCVCASCLRLSLRRRSAVHAHANMYMCNVSLAHCIGCHHLTVQLATVSMSLCS